MIGGDGRHEPRAEIVEVTGQGRPLGPIGQHSNRGVVAAAGLVVVLGLVAGIGFVNRGPVRPSEPSPAAVRPTVSPEPSIPASAGGPPVIAVSPLGPEFPATVDGLPVQPVNSAVLSGPDPGGVVAVAGYLSNDRAPDGCPPGPTTDKPDPCSGTQLVLIDQPDPVLQPNDATFLYDIVVPAGLASIQPVILPGTSAPDPWAGSSTLGAYLRSRSVVLIGQFGDPRSPECAARPGGGNAGCDRSFVVDQVAWLNGLSQGPSVWQGSGRTPVHGWRDAAAALAGWFLPALQPQFVSITSTLPADSAALTGVDLTGRANELFWVVHVITNQPGGPASSFLVFDDRTLNLVEVSGRN